MLEHCSSGTSCRQVAGKLANNVCGLFSWKQKYEVQRIQKKNNVDQQPPTILGSDNWVAVHSLQTQRDGGILDPDDRLHDVADDREQIIANFGEGEGPHHGGGDGASGSSVGTSSPDIFQGGEKFQTDIEVTNEQIASGVPGPLQVRRGSEPALNQLIPNNGVTSGSNGHCVGGLPPPTSDASKRWSAAPIITEPRDRPPGRKDDRGGGGHHHLNGYEDKWRTHLEEEEPVALRPPQAFARDGSNRLSMQFFGDNGYRWCDAADRVMLHNRMQSLSLPREHKRREPLGQANSSPQPDCEPREGTEYIVLDTGGGSLGLHVVPDYDSLGRERGLLVQGVEPGGRVDADGRLNVNDRIVEINGNNLIQQPFNVVQEIFRDSLRSQELRLRVLKGTKGTSNSGSKKQPPPPVFPKPMLTQERAEPVNMVEGEERCVGLMGSKMAMTRKVPATGASLQTGNTRKLGRKVEISLVKGQFGLGFSVTTRDNPAGGNAPIYIKNILPKGAAVEDGRLRPGDRLLAVDGTDLSGKTQADVVAILRNVPPGASVTLLVSRQADTPHSPNTSISLDGMNTPPESISTPSPNNIKAPDKELSSGSQVSKSSNENTDDSCVYPWRQREIITLDIPVHDSEKAGLGVSVKGKTSSTSNSSGNNVPNGTTNSNSSSSVDLGIFVKNVIHGGAASRDGRLKTNDQLLNVNGVSLLGQSNASAMETLRRALLRTDGPVPGAITITIARKLAHRSESVSSLLTDSSANTETFGCKIDDSPGNGENSGASENSDNTVIFKPPYNKNHIENNNVRNPMIDRLNNQNNLTHLANPLRNESYYRATHQTSMLLNSTGQLISPTVNMSPPDTVIIEDEETPSFVPNNNQPRHSDSEKNNPSAQQRNSTSSAQTADITYASQLSLDEGGGFSRDAFGRQSMSEKRHAALDAKNTDTYQRNKKAREEREKAKKEGNNNDAKTQLGPSLGMKKSSSLESLQTMVQEMQMCENEEGNYRNGQSGVRIVRGRGCNESFRAAVDRLGPLAEDEGDSPLGRQPSLNTSLESKSSKGSKKKQSLLKGIGSMFSIYYCSFRFGKTRKEVGSGANTGGVSTTTSATLEDEREAARRAARDEQLRIQEQYRKLVQKQSEFQQQHQQQQQQQQQQHLHHNQQDTKHHHQSQQHAREESEKQYGSIRMDEPSRTERINQLRLEHQRRHQERRGLYPLEDTEERYEHHIKQRLENGELDNAVTMNRPGSRVGITDPSRFSHYVNYHEIQQHLKEEIAAVKMRKSKSQTSTNSTSSDESRRQQHYHSQRQVSRDHIHRPVSNFYEYESVQAVLRAQALVESNSLPRRPDMPSMQGQHTTSNGSYNINTQQPHRYSQMAYPTTHTYHQYSGRPYGKTPGPFVTHVTIRETQPNV
ncbi:par-3 family cell polarity regulator isoform X4 [Rhodnius prolixus]|uniref:par-3 family cell polarity regulator isoform X4 n=1 Tax=Rhodnius prolixus TaxID=13249 RepID=UPI003D18AA0F